MDQETIKQYISEFFTKLPKDGQDYFSSMQWYEKIEEIALKYNLAIDELEGVRIETMLLLLGLTKPEKYQVELAVVLRQEDDAREEEIRSEIYKSIVNPIGENKIRSFFIGEEDGSNKSPNDYLETKENFFENLPKNVKRAISFSGWKKSLFQIAEKNKFNIEQSGIFEDLTIKSMKNEISSGEYRDQIKTQLSLDENKTSEVVAEVNEKIFQEIRNIMRKSEVKKDDNFESFSDINDVPVPPYAKKEEPIEIKINNTSPEKIIGVEHEEEDDAPSITRKTELSAGGIQSTDFSIPKPVINDMKNTNDTSLAKPSKSHDPYREII